MSEVEIYLTVDGKEIKVEVVEGGKRIDISHLILLRGIDMGLDAVENVILMDCKLKMLTQGGAK